MSEKVQFPETVILIDATYLNLIIQDVKKNFEQMLQRSLQEIDLSALLTYLALDAGITSERNNIQVLLVHDEKTLRLNHCQPSDLQKELNGVAFSNHIGEFTFSSISPENMVSRQELYLDLLKIVSESEETTRVILIAFEEEYGTEISEELTSVKGKQFVRFVMFQPEQTAHSLYEILAYPIMQALGIKGDEL